MENKAEQSDSEEAVCSNCQGLEWGLRWIGLALSLGAPVLSVSERNIPLLGVVT